VDVLVQELAHVGPSKHDPAKDLPNYSAFALFGMFFLCAPRCPPPLSRLEFPIPYRERLPPRPPSRRAILASRIVSLLSDGLRARMLQKCFRMCGPAGPRSAVSFWSADNLGSKHSSEHSIQRRGRSSSTTVPLITEGARL